MHDHPILFETRGDVAWLTLNRPDTRNALSGEEMFSTFEQYFERLNDDMNVRTAELALTGDTIRADQALCIGLVSRVVAPVNLHDEALALANRIAAKPPEALRWTKRLLQEARDTTLDEALKSAARFQGLAHHTADHAKAMAAFFEKRVPVFGPRGRGHV